MNAIPEVQPCITYSSFNLKLLKIVASDHVYGRPSVARHRSARWTLLALFLGIYMPLYSVADTSNESAMHIAASAAKGRHAVRSDRSQLHDDWAHALDRDLPAVSLSKAQLQYPDSQASDSGRSLLARRKRRGNGRRRRGSKAFHSLGQVRPFKGDVYPSNYLALALDNRSFKREVILLTDTRPRAALQQFDNLVQLGLAHALWLTESRTQCDALEALLAARSTLERQRVALRAQESAGMSGMWAAGATAAAAATTNANSGAGAITGANAAVDAINQSSRNVLSDAPSYNATWDLMAKIADAAAAARGRRVSTGPEVALKEYDQLGCAWYGQPFPESFQGHRQLMMKRVMLLARTLQLGYNVLSLDTDVIVFRNPYGIFKAPPYSSMHMIVGKGIRGGCIVNTGVMYFQNASRHGPVAWLLSEVISRNLRWIEFNASSSGAATGAATLGTTAAATGAAASAAGGGGTGVSETPLLTPHEANSRGCWDQLLFADVVLTMMTGKLSLLYCTRPCNRTAAAGTEGGAGGGGEVSGGGRSGERDAGANWVARHRLILGLTERAGLGDLMMQETTSVAGDPDLTALVTAEVYSTLVVNLTIPGSPLPPMLPDEPGYQLPPIRPGGAAERFRLLLAEDEHHVKATAAMNLRRLQQQEGRNVGTFAEEALVQEKGLEGGRLELGAAARRRLQQLRTVDGLTLPGLWVNPSDGSLPLPPLWRDMERLAYAADWLIGGWHHRGVLGYWDPDLTNGLPKQVFAHLVRAPGPTSTGKDIVRMQYGEYDWQLAALDEGGPYPFLGSANATVQPRVVALLPEVDTSTHSPHQWSNMARGLAQVALLTGRRVVWPSVPCSSKWVQPNPGSRRGLPLNVNLRFFAHGHFSEGLMCTPVSVLHPKCLYERLVSARNDTDGEGGEGFRREGPRGMLEVEFGVLRGLLPEAAPGPHNTVHLQGENDDYEDGGERQVMFDEPPRTEGIEYVKAPAVVAALRDGPLAAQPVLYLAQRTFLSQLDKLGDADLMTRYRTFRNECPALR